MNMTLDCKNIVMELFRNVSYTDNVAKNQDVTCQGNLKFCLGNVIEIWVHFSVITAAEHQLKFLFCSVEVQHDSCY